MLEGSAPKGTVEPDQPDVHLCAVPGCVLLRTCLEAVADTTGGGGDLGGLPVDYPSTLYRALGDAAAGGGEIPSLTGLFGMMG